MSYRDRIEHLVPNYIAKGSLAEACWRGILRNVTGSSRPKMVTVAQLQEILDECVVVGVDPDLPIPLGSLEDGV